MPEVSPQQAVEMLYRGRCNVPKAVALSGAARELLEAALAARVANEPLDPRAWQE